MGKPMTDILMSQSELEEFAQLKEWANKEGVQINEPTPIFGVFTVQHQGRTGYGLDLFAALWDIHNQIVGE